MIKKVLFKTFLLLSLIPFFGMAPRTYASYAILNRNLKSEANHLASQTGNLDPHVANLALVAYKNAVEKGIAKEPVLTIIDYSKPSVEPRLYVIDLANQRILNEALVAHGINSGGNLATRFSDVPGSDESSIGVYVTEDTYIGKHGKQLRINGLDKGYNDHALQRGIVVHSANYVTKDFVDSHGYLGRSYGCPALNPKVAQRIIKEIKGGSIVFAYYPDQGWLDSSEFLKI